MNASISRQAETISREIEAIAKKTAKAFEKPSNSFQKIDQLETLQKQISETLSTVGNQNKFVGEMLTLVNTKIKSIIASKQVAPSDVQNICQAIHAIAEQVLREKQEPELKQALPPDLQGIVLTYLSQQELKELVEQGLAGNEFKADSEVIIKTEPLTRIGDLLVKLPENKKEVELWQKEKVPFADQIAMLEIYELDTIPDVPMHIHTVHTAIAEGIREGKTLSADEKRAAELQGIPLTAARLSKTLSKIRFHLAQIEGVNLMVRNLTYIPNAISLLTNLNYLLLDGNQLTRLPDLSKNKELETLAASANRLTVTPELSENTKLRNLSLQNNQLTVAPNLGNLNFLESFDISGNNIPDEEKRKLKERFPNFHL